MHLRVAFVKVGLLTNVIVLVKPNVMANKTFDIVSPYAYVVSKYIAPIISRLF